MRGHVAMALCPMCGEPVAGVPDDRCPRVDPARRCGYACGLPLFEKSEPELSGSVPFLRSARCGRVEDLGLRLAHGWLLDAGGRPAPLASGR